MMMATATRTYRRAVITGPRQITFDEVGVPEPGHGQVLVRVAAAALCTWEQRVFAGIDTWSYPLVGGHEFAGTVEAIGPGVALRRVLGLPPRLRQHLRQRCRGHARARQALGAIRLQRVRPR